MNQQLRCESVVTKILPKRDGVQTNKDPFVCLHVNYKCMCVYSYRTNQNGVETVEVIENGMMVSKTVNGQPAALENVSGGRASAIEGSGRSKGKRSEFD